MLAARYRGRPRRERSSVLRCGTAVGKPMWPGFPSLSEMFWGLRREWTPPVRLLVGLQKGCWKVLGVDNDADDG